MGQQFYYDFVGKTVERQEIDEDTGDAYLYFTDGLMIQVDKSEVKDIEN